MAKWYTFSQTSKLIGKNRNYFSKGSKRKIADKILDQLSIRPKRIIEPFASSAAITVAAAIKRISNRFVINDSYAPGLSAQDISNKLDLNAIDSFKYLIKLEKEPNHKFKMNEKEFYKRLKDYGINLDLYLIAVGYRTKSQYYDGIYKTGDTWIVYSVGERNDFAILYEGNECDAYQYIYDILFTDIRREGFINQSVTKKIIQTSKAYVCNFLQKQYNISKSDAEDTWNYLVYDFHVLNEVKYVALNNKFVPKDDCYRVHGYSAQDISNKLDLNAIDSFKYLIKLEKEPDKYSNNLESLNLNDYKKEFLKRMHEFGINLGEYQIVVDKYIPVSYYLGVYKKDKEWIIYEVGERNQVTDLYIEYSEDKIFEEFYRNVFGRLDIMGFINQSITKKSNSNA